MSRELFMQRRDSRVAALQFLYAWSMNPPANLAEDLRVFFEGCEQPRDHYAYAEEIIQGVILHQTEIDGHIRSLAHNWDFERIAKIDLAILRLAAFEMLHRKDVPPVVSTCRSSSRTPTPSASSTASSTG